MNTNGEVITTQNPTDLLEQARTCLQRVQLALRESTDFDEILDIRDRGELFRQYSRQQKYGIEIQNTGAEIKIRVERRMGELLREMRKHKGQRLGGNIVLPPDEVPTYAELGIQKIQASRLQRTASLLDLVFKAYHLGAK